MPNEMEDYENGGADVPRAPPLEIPIRDEARNETTEVIAFDPSDLPSADDVIEVLIDQEANQMRWLRFAAAYLRAGRARECEKILIRLKGDYMPVRAGAQAQRRRNENEMFNPDKVYSHDPEGRALVGNAIAALYVHLVREQRLGSRQSADKEPDLERPISILVEGNRLEQVAPAALLSRAEVMLQQADKHAASTRIASYTWATKGEIQIEQYLWKLTKAANQTGLDKLVNTALQSFQTSLDLRPNGMRAMFGKASILFYKGQYKEARDQYARAIQVYPGADPGASRVALGLCYYELGQEGRAQECFERALELEPRSVDAQVCLAIIEMGLATESDRAAGATAQELARNQDLARRLKERANDRLRMAYELDKWNPLLKIHLANNFFNSSTKDYKRISDLAKEAFNHTTSKHIKAEAYFISARNYHAQGDMKNADTLYSTGIETWPSFPLVLFGYAQTELNKDSSAAMRAIKLVMDSADGKDDEDSLLLMGCLHAKMQTVDAALKALRRVTEKNPYRHEAWLQQALLEQSKYRQSSAAAEEAIRCYDKGIAALKFNKEPVPYEVYNNVGSLKFRVGDFAGAVSAFDLAINERGGQLYDSQGRLQLSMVTLAFNKARALEGLGRFIEAEKLYSDLSLLNDPQHPGEVHVHSQLRLAALAADRGDYETAIETYMKPLSSSVPKQHMADFYSFYGNLEIGRAKLNEVASAKPFAESKFKRVVDANPHDPYARLALANLALEEAQTLSHRKEDREKYEKLLKEASENFRSTLRRFPTNVFAADGVGVYHAMKGRYQTAQPILEKVREFADSICPSACINLGHVHVHEGAFEQAAVLYDQGLKRFYDGRDADISLYLANAKFQAGKYSEARTALLTALKFFPQDENLWFASANVDEAEAYQRLSVDAKLRTMSTVENAMKSLSRALGIYEWMVAKSLAVSRARLQKKDEKGNVESVAVRAFSEASEPLQVPHRPAEPLVPGNGANIGKPSAILLARARVAAAELAGELPDAKDLAEVRRADVAKEDRERQLRETERAQGRRLNIERALAPSVAKQVSATAVNRLAQLAAKRAEVIREEMKKSTSYLEAQRKLERKMEADRRRVEEMRQAELKRLEEERKRKEEAEEKEKEKMQERMALLAKQNEELARRFREEEEEAAKRGVRRSQRDRKKSRKQEEAEQSMKKRKNKKAKVNEDDDEDSSGEDESDTDEEEDSEEEEVDARESEEEENVADTKSSEEDEDDERKILVKAQLKKIADELQGQLSEKLTWRWFKDKCVEALGEGVVGDLPKKFFEKWIVKQMMHQQAKKRVKSADDDNDEDVADTGAVEEIEPTVGMPPKKKKKVVEDSDDEGGGEDNVAEPIDAGDRDLELAPKSSPTEEEEEL